MKCPRCGQDLKPTIIRHDWKADEAFCMFCGKLIREIPHNRIKIIFEYDGTMLKVSSKPEIDKADEAKRRLIFGLIWAVCKDMLEKYQKEGKIEFPKQNKFVV